MNRQPDNRRLQFWIGILLSLASLFALFFFIDPAQIWQAIIGADYVLLALSAACLVAFLTIRAIRWRYLLSGSNPEQSATFRQIFHIQNIGYMLNNLLPFRLGDVSRAVLIGTVPPFTMTRGLVTLLLERVVDLLFMVTLFPLTIWLAKTKIPSEIYTAVVIAGILGFTGIGLLVILANKRIWATSQFERVIQRIPVGNKSSWTNRFNEIVLGLDSLTGIRKGAEFGALTILVWSPIFLGYFVGMHAVGLEVTFVQAMFVVCMAAFSVTVPSSPGQVGVFEGGVTFAIAVLLGEDQERAAGFAFLFHAVNYLTLGILGLIGIQKSGTTLQRIILLARSRTHESSSTVT